MSVVTTLYLPVESLRTNLLLQKTTVVNYPRLPCMHACPGTSPTRRSDIVLNVHDMREVPGTYVHTLVCSYVRTYVAYQYKVLIHQGTNIRTNIERVPVAGKMSANNNYY